MGVEPVHSIPWQTFNCAERSDLLAWKIKPEPCRDLSSVHLFVNIWVISLKSSSSFGSDTPLPLASLRHPSFP